MHALEVHELHRSFGDVQAVRGVSFSIGEGEVLGLLGPNGAGKSTTISMIAGLLAPSGGDARIAGHSVREAPLEARRHLGLVPQDLAIYEDLTPQQNLVFWGRMAGLAGGALRSRVEEVLEEVSLADRRKSRSATLSGGMKRRLNIAIALLARPSLVIMDEPTVGIDPQSRRHILDGVKRLHEQGTAVLYTTHYMEEAAELSDRIVIVDHGKVIAEGTHDELIRIVGERDRIELEVPRGLDAFARAVCEVPGVDGVETAEGRATLLVEDGARLLPRLLETAVEAGASVTSVAVHEPNLEAVFLHLTGRTLRD